MKTTLTAVAAIACISGSAIASPLYDQNVTGDVIFGSGNANGSFTVNQDNGIELGLRAKVRFNGSNEPENTFNSNGYGSYTFRAGSPAIGYGAGSTSTATWNFEWSINSDFDGTSGEVLSDFTYLIKIDFDPGAGTNFLTFDPINQDLMDNAMGDNNTANGAGTRADNATEYESLIDSKNIAQNSWNMEFFDGGMFPFNAGVLGEYEIVLEAYDSEGDLANSNSITINVVPLPGASAMAGLGLLAIGTRRRRN